jgi:molybdate transport system substrate-binding protein
MNAFARCLGLPAVAALAILTACGDEGRAAGASPAIAPVRVFAAASLTAAFEAIGTAFERANPGARVELHFAGSPQLVLQLREGAAADVFAAADLPNMQKVQDRGAVAGQPVEFARNQLAIVVRAGNPKQVQRLADLGRADLKVALCAPEVPAGKYARQALAAQRLEVRSLSDEPSVKAVVSKVQLGELDAGIVYTTDCRVQGVESVVIPSPQNVVASYPIAVLQRGANRAGGEAFVAFVRSEAGRTILHQHGFVLP